MPQQALRTLLFFFTCFLTVPAFADENVSVPASVFALTSPAFVDNAPIPDRYTCRGSNLNPPLRVSHTPQGARSLVLTVHDPDGLSGEWVHWVVFNIPPEVIEIPENSVPGTQALNDFGNFYYGGPCPPDDKQHHYVFMLYALKAPLGMVNEGATKDIVDKAMRGLIMARSQLTGVYQNAGGR